MGPGKEQAMREVAERDGIDLSASFAYTDSSSDLPMLELVGNPVVVNPEKELKAMAVENDWPILRFQRPVAIGPRVPAPPPKVWVSVAAGLVVAIAIAAASRHRSQNA
jgi:hypothetical protein